MKLPGGEEAILKVAVPHKDFSTEMEALVIYEGRGINRQIDLDLDLNAMLLERLCPGTTLAQHPERKERAEITGRILICKRRHHRPTTICLTSRIGCTVRFGIYATARKSSGHNPISIRWHVLRE